MDIENLSLCAPRSSAGGDPRTPVLCTSPVPDVIPSNHILLMVDRFGFSANNITYQALGEAPHFRYFDFHPTPVAAGVSPRTHGLIPVWGFGTVIASTHPRIPVGERVYGYLAPTRYLLLPISPSDVNKYSFFVPRPHLPADRRPYNQIIRCATDAQYDPSSFAEDITMLYRPLFWTSFWCEDWLYCSSYHGAQRILVSSASSKTAFCLAYLLRKRARQTGLPLLVIGLTSKRNLAFTKGLGLYDGVADYGTLETCSLIKVGDERWIYIDVAGNEALNEHVMLHFAGSGRLAAGVQLGLTNLSPSSPAASSTKWTTNTALALPPPSTSAGLSDGLEQFFMPEWLALRRKQLSIAQITNMQADAWRGLMKDGRHWVTIKRVCGGEEVKAAYQNIANQGLGPEAGMVWSLWDNLEPDDRTQGKL